ncbi:phage GP46 family protein [Tianweitania sp. BSSL-BM11]|uniref:Phage GP46 family protein n=1 Tax=Tianweitania aestuarii TaxID=2814886 RepID=A0ABS5RSY9_9HYPH|nr:phage GP46 family protein [Tianweitania aestuarii]MBS9720168.1 phage GP46 family protein [Tianweitania aestuarii]
MRVIPLDKAAEPILAPDLAWNGLTGDLAIDVASGDLRSANAIATAVLICLQTDRRVDISELPAGETNRGWPGDAFDLQPGDTPLGSKLWLLRRRALSEDIDIEAEDYAREAIQPLIDQGLAVRQEVSVERLPLQNRLIVSVALYGRDGNRIYQDQFAVFWDQLNAS